MIFVDEVDENVVMKRKKNERKGEWGIKYSWLLPW